MPMRLRLFAMIMLTSSILILYGMYLTLMGIEVSYDVVRVPEYSFEIVGPGNVTEVYEAIVSAKTIKDRVAAPGKALEYSFTLGSVQKEQEKFFLSVGYVLYFKTGLFTPSGHVLKYPLFKIHLYQVYNNGSPGLLANLTSHFELSHKVVDIDEAVKLGIVKNRTVVHGYRYVVAGGFSHDLTKYAPGTFKLEIIFTNSAYIEHLQLAAKHVCRRSVYVPFQMVRNTYRDPVAHMYKVASEISFERFQLGVILMCIGLAIPIFYVVTILALGTSAREKTRNC
ncbi:MAG: hypothetical protein DRJ60_05400 [Thermoprotei archaeon]|nr:MAG: hypothetical protein DRJ60_05400 [Thermoprotei archaeon]